MKKLIILGFLIGLVSVIFVVYFKEEASSYQVILDKGLAEGGDGFFVDTVGTGKDDQIPFASKYYFKGNEVDNYFWHQNHCYRIISIANNDTIKLVHLGKSNNESCENVIAFNYLSSFSDEKKNNWEESDILNLFKEWEGNNTLFDAQFSYNDFVEADWFIGSVDGSDRTSDNHLRALIDHIKDERNNAEVYRGKIGLISLSEYLKATVGIQHSYASSKTPRANYLFNQTSFWTLTADKDDQERVYVVTAADIIDDGVPFRNNKNSMSRIVFADDQNYTFYPVLYLKAEMEITGQGTMEEPYIVK